MTLAPSGEVERAECVHSLPTIRGSVVLKDSSWERVVDWGEPSHLGSPAFWIAECHRSSPAASMRMGQSLAEEVALCLLGGYGVNELMSTHAFWALRDAGLLDTARPPHVQEVEAVLREPLVLPGYARPVRYRFPSQRAGRVAAAVSALAEEPIDVSAWSPRDLRGLLTRLDGVGLKTASWIVRNLTRSNDIAVIDVHVRRAGVVAGIFDPKWTLPRDYLTFEQAFCAWARAGGVETADLDLCVWSTLARIGTRARLIFGVNRLADLD